METVAAEFASDVLNAFVATSADATSASRPLFVALAGVPGSGKSTLARMVADILNSHGRGHNDGEADGGGSLAACPRSSVPTAAEMGASQVVAGGVKGHLGASVEEDFGYAATGPATDIRLGQCFVMGMDGYHMTRAELDKMADPAEAHRRRGAHWTFDVAKLRKDLQTLKETGCLAAPTFDHAKRDPATPTAITIDARTVTQPLYHSPDEPMPTGCDVYRCIVIVEGLYLALQEPAEWAAVSALFDLVAFVQCDAAVAVERLVQRHMAAWGIPRAEALERASGSDAENAVLVEASSINAHVVFETIEDTTLISCHAS